MIQNHLNSAKHGRERNENFPKDEKRRLVEHRKIILKSVKKLVLKILVITHVKKRYTES